MGPVHVTALGGVGEVGKNSTLLECDNSLVLIDCGVQFPSPEHLGDGNCTPQSIKIGRAHV